MNSYFTESKMHLPSTYSELSVCPRFQIHHSKERVYLPIYYKLQRYKIENICFRIYQEITLNLYLVPFVCDCNHLTLLFYIMLCNEWKALLGFISLKIIPEKFCDYLSPLFNISLEDSRGQKYQWRVNTLKDTCWITNLAVSSIDQYAFLRAL